MARLKARQDMFDKAAIGLLTQMKKSRLTSDYSDTCQYRGPNGMKCAIGFLIPDDLYELAMEGGLEDLLIHYPKVARYIPDLHLASALMSIHDQTEPETWAGRLALLAAMSGLNANALRAFPYNFSSAVIAAETEAAREAMLAA